MTEHDKRILQNKIIDEIRIVIGEENTGLITPYDSDELITLKLEKYYFLRDALTKGISNSKIKEMLQ